ncbi:MAG TPA: NBR1-Ig-like domain-containing protein [Anaerolineales bacterium]|nr:NBR1-Ig-like domain-containing protein [Anaerolineales bacterium]
MNKKVLLVFALFLSACISVEMESTPAPTQAGFVTATLPPTKTGYVPPTITVTPAITPTPTFAVTIDPNCKDSAVLVRDVTIQDGTRVNPGETFTKTWEFINNGTCPWYGYALKFAAGDQMNAPLSAPITDTLPKESVQVSVELTAPTANGSYTGYFTLNNPNGKDVPIGVEKTFWVKITVGSGGGTSLQPTSSGGANTPSGSTGGGGNCSYTQNAGYVNQIAALINQERANAGLPALTINSLLTNAAQAHAADMACSGRISHTGSDGSSAYARILASGYSPSYAEEIIYGGGGPQAAMTWWMNDQIHRNAILNAKSTEMGVGYAYYSNGSYGDFIVVDFGSP